MNLESLKQTRRYLHQHPERSGEEQHTQAYLKKQLEKLNHQGIQEIGGTGLVVFFKGHQKGRQVLLRADIDALPIQEVNDFAHASVHEGVSHKCGHDGHSTILLGVAQSLSENPPERGEVCLVFQPAEENGKGARAILEDPAFQFKTELAFALHNLPGYPLHQVVCRKGSFTAAARSVIFRFKGKTAHAAEPEAGYNPAIAMAKTLLLSEQLSQKDIAREDFSLITHIYAELGEKAYGVSAGYGEVHLTLRSWDNRTMDKLVNELLKEVQSIARAQKLLLETEWLEVFFANQNHKEAYAYIRESAEALGLDYSDRAQPFKWGEDFGLFTQKTKGAMFGIGSGEHCPALHNPDYDYPDEITETGIRMFVQLLQSML